MGYFSNGSEGEAYHAFYCDRCVHDVNRDCAVWLCHVMANYEDSKNPESLLHVLIPRSKDGLENAKCKMFHLREGAEPLPPPDRTE